ncbi:MAG: outer membrane beta-barrel protein [Ignavibacteriales bacterium]|nr:outer membrane beta-barrel protein [Ignavibacteriales bacterium]
MKSFIFLMLLVFSTSLSFAQISNGRIELSANGSLGSVSSSTNSYESEARTYLTTSIKAGYIFYQGLEIEPELYTLIAEKSKPSFLISSNLVYNKNISETTLFPFLLIGYGIGNSFPFLTTSNAFIRISNEFDVKCLNAGFGIKYYFNDNIGLRVEYRYQRYNDKIVENYNNTVYNYDLKLNIHSLLFGFSILF